MKRVFVTADAQVSAVPVKDELPSCADPDPSAAGSRSSPAEAEPPEPQAAAVQPRSAGSTRSLPTAVFYRVLGM